MNPITNRWCCTFYECPRGEFFTRTAHRNVPGLARCAHARGRSRTGACGEARRRGRRCARRRSSARSARRGVAFGGNPWPRPPFRNYGPDEGPIRRFAATLGYKSNNRPSLFSRNASHCACCAPRSPTPTRCSSVSPAFSTCRTSASHPQTREYLRGLWEKWWPQRAEHERLKITPALCGWAASAR